MATSATQDATDTNFSHEKQRPDYYLSKADMKLLGITAPLSTMLQFELFAGHTLPPNLEGLLKSAALIGSAIGQLIFGYLGDAFGRKAIYGTELLTIIIGTILCLSTPTKQLSPSASLVYLAIFRIIVGIGVGGDYPMTSSIISDRTTPHRRGAMLAYTVSMQGWGSLAGNLVTIIVLSGYKHMIHEEGQVDKLDAVWRIVVAVSLIPAFATVYQRLTLPESPLHLSLGRRYQDLNRINHVDVNRDHDQEGADDEKAKAPSFDEHHPSQPPSADTHKKAHIHEFIQYFSEWKHAKLLIGTCLSWFFTNIAFYGVNLNQNFFDHHPAWVPSGYYFTILTSEKLGRKWIQIQGSLMTAIFMAILAAKFHTLNKASFIACFAFLQVNSPIFFNFGANMTVYVRPRPLPLALSPGSRVVSDNTCGAVPIALPSVGTWALSFQRSMWGHYLIFTVQSAGAYGRYAGRFMGSDLRDPVFFGACLATAVVTWFLLPEAKGRNADVVFEQELREKEVMG
ncbi:hypothetical protein ONZ45_g6145 [Pleurotus djamor]|nr:hypothetical protein ONZ45_g6145 [Pleurotus djamor]